MINLTGKYSGTYQYNTQREQPEGRFILNLKQDSPNTFSGTCSEEFTNFGTPAADGRLWSDIRNGRIWKSTEGVKIRFLKDYRGSPPSRIVYEGTYNPATKRASGKWQAEAGMGADGTFSLTLLPAP